MCKISDENDKMAILVTFLVKHSSSVGESLIWWKWEWNAKMVYASGVEFSQRDRVNIIKTRGGTRVERQARDERRSTINEPTRAMS